LPSDEQKALDDFIAKSSRAFFVQIIESIKTVNPSLFLPSPYFTMRRLTRVARFTAMRRLTRVARFTSHAPPCPHPHLASLANRKRLSIHCE
jgi:hypothetical protein